MTTLAGTALRHPEGTALSDPRHTLRYRELAAAAAQVASALARLGVAPGARVATVLPTTIEHAVILHGIAWAGAVAVPMHPRLTRDELDWQVRDVGAVLVVTAERLAELLVGDGRPDPVPSAPGQLATILYTSGTTGRPKPVPLTWANHGASLVGALERLGSDPDDDWLCPLPLAHVGGLAVLLRSTALGTAATLLEGFSPEVVAELLAGGRITLASMVPTMVRRLLARERPLPAPRLRAILLGGGPVDEDTLARARGLGLPLAPTYGLTEAASQVCTVAPADATVRGTSVGRPIAGAEVAVRDDAGRPVAAGTVGTVWVRGPMVTAGYLDRPEDNARRFDRDGWFATGDLGWLDATGCLTIESRREDLIVTGGENVYPAEVEALLARHPAVVDCAVFGVEDELWGQRVTAAVVARPGNTPAAAELLAHLRTRLAPFKLPKSWLFLPELPRTASGKVRRAELRELAGAPNPPPNDRALGTLPA